MRSIKLGGALLIIGQFAVAAMAAVGDLHVTSDALNKSMVYNGVSGLTISDPFTTVAAGAQGPLGVHVGTTNNRMLVGHFTGGVNEFDANTGAYVKTYNVGASSMNWAGVYAPNGDVYAGDSATNSIYRYDANTGAQIGTFANMPAPSDMRIGPNGNLYVCSFTPGGGVWEFNATNGAFVSQWATPPTTLANDIAFLPDGRILVTTMDVFGPGGSDNRVWVYDAAHTLLTSFAGTGWGRPHGIDISPHDGNIYVIDGVTAQAHVFDPATYGELNAAFLVPYPSAKTVDLEFRRIPEPAGAALIIGALFLLRWR
ncbi:MAG: hypothetical protein JNG88_16060 [Phycisphaerales bacterium]|nr:hypothetical protein [Phycisphaerales bacterium]